MVLLLRLCWRMTQMVESGVTPPDAKATLAVAPTISGSFAGAFVYGRGIPLRVPWLSDCTVAFIRQQSLLREGLDMFNFFYILRLCTKDYKRRIRFFQF